MVAYRVKNGYRDQNHFSELAVNMFTSPLK